MITVLRIYDEESSPQGRAYQCQDPLMAVQYDITITDAHGQSPNKDPDVYPAQPVGLFKAEGSPVRASTCGTNLFAASCIAGCC